MEPIHWILLLIWLPLLITSKAKAKPKPIVIIVYDKNGGERNMDLKVGVPVVLVAEEFDAFGNKVSLPLTWTVSDTAILALAVAPDGLSVTVTALGPVGAATVSAAVASVTSDPFGFNAIAGDVVRIVLTVRP